MFFDVFKQIGDNLNKPKKIGCLNLPSINPSSQVCYSSVTGQQLGSCVRQVWFDKTGQPKTNPLGLKVKMAGFVGEFWEKWFIDQAKQIHIYDDENITVTVFSKMVKGLVDITINNPNTSKLELGEIKTYDGGNYYASKGVVGSVKEHPKPKDNHLLQAFRYLLIEKDNVEAINLFYIDRSCSAWYKNKQFRVTLKSSDGRLFPSIETIWNDNLYSYTDVRITDEGIDDAETALLNALNIMKVPAKEYELHYTSSKVRTLYEEGVISETAFTKYQKDAALNPIGDYQCKNCAYSYGTCENFVDD